MSTNYCIIRTKNECSHCGRYEQETLRIADSAGGWRMLFYISDRTPQAQDDYIKFIRENDGNIYDERGARISATELIEKAESKKDQLSGERSSKWDIADYEEYEEYEKETYVF